MDIYHELVTTDIRHVLVRHEQAAIHAADGYARATGAVGVCLVTSGPGATNTVTGIASAYMDSIPVVIFSGQVPTPLIGNDAFQEVDIVGITRPCTKHNFLVKDPTDLPRIVKEAFHIAKSGRPGPVLVDLPKDVVKAKIVVDTPHEVKLKSYNPTYNPNMKQLKKVVDLVQEAERPVIFAGGGVILSKASKALTDFARKTQIPVTTSLMGLGAFPGTDPLWLGMIGMHGTYRANLSTGNCDLLISIGVRFDDRVTGKTDAFAAQAKIVHIDIDPTSIRKNIPVSIPVVGDCRLSLERLIQLINDRDLGDIQQKRKNWMDQIEQWKNTKPLSYEQGDSIKPQYVIEKLYQLTKGNAIITTEVGQNQMWAAQYYHFDKPNHFITSGGLGCMGFGLPAAIGAQMACPDRLVVDIAGDGSIQMNIQEMATAVQCGLPVKVVILNNGYLGMVRQWQELFYEKRYACTCMDHAPDFVKLAEAYGAVGLRATKPQEVESVLSEGLSTPKTVVMDFVVEKEESVYPMVPAGAPITEMLLV
jgi:acetolactate synthase-1/2/3 large subunit